MGQGQSELQLKKIFEYDNYRNYLRDYYLYSKARNRNFSYRFFARIGGFKSGNILKIVIDGKINIQESTIEKFCKALKLNKEESHFFKNLVLFNQAKSSQEKQLCALELLRSRTFKSIYPLSEYQYRYFDVWYLPIVRGLVALPSFQEDPQWIATRISPPISSAEAGRAIQELLALELLSRNEKGALVQSSPTVTTSNAIISSSLAQYHREMLKRAAESIDRFPRDRRDLSVMTLAVSAESVKIIKDMVEKFRKEIVEVVAQDTTANMIYQLNTYLFPTAEDVVSSDLPTEKPEENL